MTDEVREISAEEIDDPVNPMRSELDRDSLFELAESIKREGLINPITVRPANSRYEVVAGHRRFAACRIAGKLRIPCVVRELDDTQAYEITAHENLFREDVDPVDEALFLGRLIGENESKITEVAEKLNHSEQWVRSRLEILTYPDYLISAVKHNAIKLGVASYLGRIQDEAYRKMFVDSAVRDGMSVSHARYLHDLWEQGVLKDSAQVIPPQREHDTNEPPKVRAWCSRCGGEAVEPNLHSVFVHRECPRDSGGAAS